MCPLRELVEYCLHALPHRVIEYRDAANQGPIEYLPDQKFRLLAALPIVIVRLIRPVTLADDSPIHFIQPGQVVVLVGETGQTMTVRKYEPASRLLHSLRGRYQIDQRRLTFVVIRHPPGLEVQQHHRQRAEVEGHVIVNRTAWPAGNGFDLSAGLNRRAVNGPVGQSVVRGTVWSV
mgnify:CR=1 FL=1